MKVFVENRDRSVYGGRRSALAVGAHYHSHYEVIYIKKGHSLISIDGCVYPLKDGDLVVALPFQVHRIQDIVPCESYLFIVPDNICEEYRNNLSHSVPVNPVIHHIEKIPLLSRLLNEAIDTMESDHPFANEMVKGYLIVILGLCFGLMEFVPSPATDGDVFRKIVQFCTEHYDHPLSLEQLSKQFYLSRYQISRLFSRNVGMSFPRFLAGIRIMEACHLLRNGVPITQAALQSGFTTIRSFNRCFLEQTGMTPKQYKQSVPAVDHSPLI